MPSVLNYSSYREFLRAVYLNRKGADADYTLRDFAEHLQIAPSTLSAVLRGKRALSRRTVIKIAGRLNLSQAEVDYMNSLQRAPKKMKISEKLYDDLAHWQTLALLEALRMPELKQDLKQISRRLGVAEKVLRAHFKTLLNKQIIVQRDDGCFIKVA